MISKTALRMIFVTWGYCIIKSAAGYKLMEHYEINPWIFFLIDMLSVPTFVLGWEFLLRSLVSKDVKKNRDMIFWGALTFLSSTSPYLYAAWAGRNSFPSEGWIILIVIMLFPAVNLLRNIKRKVNLKSPK